MGYIRAYTQMFNPEKDRYINTAELFVETDSEGFYVGYCPTLPENLFEQARVQYVSLSDYQRIATLPVRHWG